MDRRQLPPPRRGAHTPSRPLTPANWDAFEDFLRDLTPVTVVIREAGQLLAEEPDGVLHLLMTILGDVAGRRGEEGPALLLLLDDEPDRLAGLGRRLAAAGWVTSLPGSYA
ncbi:barstar family protein [Streptomyces sp. NPDC005474]|uniref:barstar family protein n=1 Tax=Streptomyces sp. NPDC005474 TaxID=3154878 RepID=UPI003456DA5F